MIDHKKRRIKVWIAEKNFKRKGDDKRTKNQETREGEKDKKENRSINDLITNYRCDNNIR